MTLLTPDGTRELELDEYLTAVVLCEMPPDFEPEALRAQAVAARTFACRQMRGGKHEGGAVCASSACCQAWRSEDELRERLGIEFDADWEKAADAVTATHDEVLTYDGALIDATFFSCSGGRTEAAVAVWGSDVPYLQSVESIGKNCTIGPDTFLEDVRVGDGSSVRATHAFSSTIGYDAQVGPFAYIRPGSTIGNGVKVGDFVEVKNSVVGDGTKIAHLTYVGDSDVGERVNFGCGTVTVNYDRAQKHRTVIGNDAFIGCNTNLVAPVTVGDGAYTAAGSTITEDVPAQALAVARAHQSNKKDWAAKHKLKQPKPEG